MAMDALHIAYPKDLEAQAFYGLGLAAEEAAGGDDSEEAAHKALAVLLPGFQKDRGIGSWLFSRLLRISRTLMRVCARRRRPSDPRFPQTSGG